MSLLVLLLLAQVQPLNLNVQPVVVKDEGVRQGNGSASTLDCVGAGVTCTKSGTTMTLNVTGGETTAAMTLYVDPSGNNSNACTATGASACLTMNGALAKVPRTIRHNVSITPAAGTYAGTVAIAEFQFMAAGGVIPTMTIQGSSWTTPTLTTGTTSGTLTAYAASVASPLVLTTLTDSGQSWTVDELKGRYVAWTSGTPNGTRRVITSNTATTLTITTDVTGAAAGNTYAIQTPAAVLGAVTITGVGGAAATTGTLILSDIETGALTLNSTTFPSHSGILLRRMRTIGAVSVSRASATTSTNSNYILGNVTLGAGVNGGGVLEDQAGYYRGIIALGSGTFINTNGTGSAVTVVEASTTPLLASTARGWHGPMLVGGYPFVTQRMWLICTAGSSTGVLVTGPVSSLGTLNFGTLNITGCTNGLDVTKGVRLAGATSTWTFSGVTNDLTLDGAVTSLATFNALTPRVLTTTNTTRLLGD